MIGPPPPSLDQCDTTKDKRPHDSLAELGVGNQQRTKFVGRDSQRFDLVLCVSVD